MQVKTIRIIKGSSPDREGLLAKRIAELKAAGFHILFDDVTPDPSWPYCAGSVQERATAFAEALIEDESDAVMWARGGYGSSELLPLIPWSTIRTSKAKPIVGFSDTCAAQSALYTMTGRVSIHGPMPAAATWRRNGDVDVDLLMKLLRGETSQGSLTLAESRPHPPIDGTLFGGNLAVLTSLIGTPYLLKSLAGHILLFEDIDENPGRVVRMLNQWQQSGMFAGVKAVVLGAFTGLGANLPDNAPVLFDEIKRRFGMPIFTTADFGHISPNMPYVVGSHATIHQGTLKWQWQSSHGRSPVA